LRGAAVQNYSQQVAAPVGVVSTPGEPAASAGRRHRATGRDARAGRRVDGPDGRRRLVEPRVLVADRSVLVVRRMLAPIRSIHGKHADGRQQRGQSPERNRPPDGVIDQPLGSSKRGGLNIVGNTRSRIWKS